MKVVVIRIKNKFFMFNINDKRCMCICFVWGLEVLREMCEVKSLINLFVNRKMLKDSILFFCNDLIFKIF